MPPKQESRLFAAPADPAAEERLLAFIVRQPRFFEQCAERLTSECFFDSINRAFFEWLCEFLPTVRQVDSAGLLEAARVRFVDAETGVVRCLEHMLQRREADLSTLAQDIRKLLTKYRLRRIFQLADALNRQDLEREPAESLAVLSEELHGAVLDLCGADDGVPTAQTRTMQALETVEGRYEAHGSRQRRAKRGKLLTGISVLDRVADGGLSNEDFMIIAGGTGVGKTALAIAITRNITAVSRLPVAFFTFSLPAQTIIERILCADAKQDLTRCTDGNFKESDFAPLTSAAERLAGLQLFVDDAADLSLSGICARVYRLKKAQNIAAVVIDGGDLLAIRAATSDPSEKLAGTLVALKRLAHRAGIPVIVCCCLPERENPAGAHTTRRTRESSCQALLRSHADVFAMISRRQRTQRAVERLEVLLALQRRGYVGRFGVNFDAGSGALSALNVQLLPTPGPVGSELL